MEQETMITIPISVWNEMIEDANMLDALRAAGVDNWQGWDEAMEILEGFKDE